MSSGVKIAVIIVVIIVVLGYCWYMGWLNSYLPANYQYTKSTFVSPPSTLDPNTPCFATDSPLAVNTCAHI